jgi:signal transduction histidine kinase
MKMSYISIFHYFFIGVLCFQCMYMAVSFVLFKRKDTFFFFLFLLLSIPNFCVLNYSLFNVSVTEFENSKLLKILYYPISCIIIGFYYLFIIQFLEFKSNNKKLFHFLYLNVIIDIAVGVVFCVLEYLNIAYLNAFVALAFLGYLSSIFTIYFLFKSKLKYSRIILLGCISSSLGSSLGLIMIYIYGNKPPVEPHLLTEIGMLFDVFIYSIALNLKWNESEKSLLQEQIEKSFVVSKERQRIASEMHDELGGNLTSLIYSAHNLKEKSHQEGHIEKIIKSSGEISDSINEIVWALYQEQNTLEDWVVFVRERTSEMLENTELKYRFHVPESIPKVELTNEVKRSLYLVVKEAINNVIKHAHATKIDIYFRLKKEINIEIRDNGIGFLENGSPKAGGGNGLKNMSRRMEEIGGTIAWSNGEGTRVKISLT